jgi:hypothetical protein
MLEEAAEEVVDRKTDPSWKKEENTIEASRDSRGNSSRLV